MRFEWDPEKSTLNKKKHGIAFEDACYVFADKYMLTLPDEAHSQDEERWITLGQGKQEKCLVIIHTCRHYKHQEATRIISARKATKNETRNYLERRKS